MIPYRSNECAEAMRKVKHIAWFPPDVDWGKWLGRFVRGFVGGLLYAAAMALIIVAF